MNTNEIDNLKLKYEKFCYDHKIDSALYDIDAKIDRSLAYFENWEIIEEELDRLAADGTLLEKQAKQVKSERERQFLGCRSKQEANLSRLFDKPSVIAVCSDVNEGKSMALYYLMEYLKDNFALRLFSYGLRAEVPGQEIYSVEELEQIRDSVIVADEFFTLFDLEDRKKKKQVESTLRLIHHNNNILILSGVPENFKKFISAKVDIAIFKKITINDFINGSRIKSICTSYHGPEMGSTVLDIPINEALVFDGEHYSTLMIPYLQMYDTKLKNVRICVPKSVPKSVPNNVQK